MPRIDRRNTYTSHAQPQMHMHTSASAVREKTSINTQRTRATLDIESQVAMEVLVIRFAGMVHQGPLHTAPSQFVVVT